MKDDPQQTPAPVNRDEALANESGNGSKQVADITREQIKRIYEETPPNAPAGAPKAPAMPNPPEAPKTPNPYGRTHKSDFDWRQYHSAWQEYYQEYYRRYYHHLNSKKALQEGAKAEVIAGTDSEKVKLLKQDVLSQVRQQATKIKRSHHFWPLVTAMVVGLAFLFMQFNSVVFAQVGSYISPGALEGQKLVITDPTTGTSVGPEPKLVIPKINVDIPVNFDTKTLNEPEIQKALEDAAVHYNLPGANAMPGQFGNSVILGHSSNDVFARGNYKFALVLADQLVPGDTFYVHYNSTRYTYKVTDKKVIKPHEIGALRIGDSKPMLTLVTCTPAGTAINRLLVYGEQISPDPAGASKATPEQNQPSDTPSIPGNAPTLVEQLLGLFF